MAGALGGALGGLKATLGAHGQLFAAPQGAWVLFFPLKSRLGWGLPQELPPGPDSQPLGRQSPEREHRIWEMLGLQQLWRPAEGTWVGGGQARMPVPPMCRPDAGLEPGTTSKWQAPRPERHRDRNPGPTKPSPSTGADPGPGRGSSGRGPGPGWCQEPVSLHFGAENLGPRPAGPPRTCVSCVRPCSKEHGLWT